MWKPAHPHNLGITCVETPCKQPNSISSASNSPRVSTRTYFIQLRESNQSPPCGRPMGSWGAPCADIPSTTWSTYLTEVSGLPHSGSRTCHMWWLDGDLASIAPRTQQAERTVEGWEGRAAGLMSSCREGTRLRPCLLGRWVGCRLRVRPTPVSASAPATVWSVLQPPPNRVFDLPPRAQLT